jgi:hypothetical protein
MLTAHLLLAPGGAWVEATPPPPLFAYPGMSWGDLFRFVVRKRGYPTLTLGYIKFKDVTSKNSVCSSQKTHSILTTKTNTLPLFMEIIDLF